MSTRYYRVTELAQVWRWVAQLDVKTVVFDVEPLVAFWDTDRQALQEGVDTVLDGVAIAATVRHVVFATNSARTLSVGPTVTGVDVTYLASAGKPMRTASYRRLPEPGVVVGDQVATDGLLARRLGYAFLHYCPDLPRIPPGPRLMRLLGRPLRRVLFGDD